MNKDEIQKEVSTDDLFQELHRRVGDRAYAEECFNYLDIPFEVDEGRSGVFDLVVYNGDSPLMCSFSKDGKLIKDE